MDFSESLNIYKASFSDRNTAVTSYLVYFEPNQSVDFMWDGMNRFDQFGKLRKFARLAYAHNDKV
jgi:hypothetical protein